MFVMEEKWNKYFQEELTGPEKQELFTWLDADLEAKKGFLQLHNIWGMSTLISQKQDTRTAQEGQERFFGQIKKKNRRQYFLSTCRYAAVICLVFAGSWMLATHYSRNNTPITYTEIEVPTGQRLCITLGDGSSVWLSPRSKLKYPNDFYNDKRIVELDGEGYFTVAQDKKRPFIVKSKGYNIEVLGTKFNLFSYSGNPRYETHLVEGKVQVYKENDHDKVIFLSPNEKLSLVKNKLIKSVSPFDNGEFIANGIYNFQTAPFGDILEYLSLWYDVRFDVKHPDLSITTVSAKFRLNDDIENILIALQNTFRFQFKRLEDNVIEISK